MCKYSAQEIILHDIWFNLWFGKNKSLNIDMNFDLVQIWTKIFDQSFFW